MVKRMSTPDIYVAYYGFTWRVYGFLAGCKGMRRKNAGANDSWVDRVCVRRHKFDTCHPHFPFFRPLSHRTRIQKDIWTARREGVRVWTRRKEEYTLEIFLIVPFRGFLTVLSSSKTVISSYVDEIRNEENCRRSSNDIWSRIWWGIYFSHGENLRTPPSRQFEFPISPLWNGRWNGRYGNFNFKFNFEFIASIDTKFKLQ